MAESNLRLFVDMDGTLAEFQTVDTLETLYEEGYFLNLKPQPTVVNAVRQIIRKNPEVEVNILSAVLTDSKYALAEKNRWIDKYLPEIDAQHRIFPPCGADKKEFIEGGVGPKDFLLDDYSVNLNSWEPPARGIKIMNGINGTKGTWTSDRLSMERSGEDLADKVIDIMENDAKYRDVGPAKEVLLQMQQADLQETMMREQIRKEELRNQNAVNQEIAVNQEHANEEAVQHQEQQIRETQQQSHRRRGR